MLSKPRILLKISGGQLKNENNIFFFDDYKLEDLIFQIKQLSKKYAIGIVVGGGNIWRGKENYLCQLSDINSDYVGMLATVMNGIVIKDLLQKNNLKTRLFSAIQCEKITEVVYPDAVEKAFANDEILIFSGGTSFPFFTTDSAAILRAIEINAEIVLFGKSGVSGVYDKDPRKYETAVFIPKLSYQEIINKELDVMDNASLILAKQHKLKILVFDQSLKNCFVDALENKIKLTEIF